MATLARSHSRLDRCRLFANRFGTVTVAPGSTAAGESTMVTTSYRLARVSAPAWVRRNAEAEQEYKRTTRKHSDSLRGVSNVGINLRVDP